MKNDKGTTVNQRKHVDLILESIEITFDDIFELFTKKEYLYYSDLATSHQQELDISEKDFIDYYKTVAFLRIYGLHNSKGKYTNFYRNCVIPKTFYEVIKGFGQLAKSVDGRLFEPHVVLGKSSSKDGNLGSELMTPESLDLVSHKLKVKDIGMKLESGIPRDDGCYYTLSCCEDETTKSISSHDHKTDPFHAYCSSWFKVTGLSLPKWKVRFSARKEFLLDVLNFCEVIND